MQQLILELNQSKINKIVSKYVATAGDYARHRYIPDYMQQADWIKAAVMHMDHLRQDKFKFKQMQNILTLMQNDSLLRDFVNAQWEKIYYSDFLSVINCFEPSMQMRSAQKKFSTQEDDLMPHQNPVVLQDDDKFLLMRAETPNAAIEAKERIEKATKQAYSWCISSRSNNLFMRYRVDDRKKPVTAYFVLDKKKDTDDSSHAVVLHVSASTILRTNASNVDPKTVPAHAVNDVVPPGLDASKLIVQPFFAQEKSALTGGHSNATAAMFLYKSYDDKIATIQQYVKFTDTQYSCLDKKLQHLYVHYLVPRAPTSLQESIDNIQSILKPLQRRASPIDVIKTFNPSTVEELIEHLGVTNAFIKLSHDKNTKDYYVKIVKRAVNDAARFIEADYI